jgi:O-antigen ligase
MGMGAVLFGLFSVVYNLFGNNIVHDYRLLGPLDSAVYLAYFLAPFFIFFTIQFFENKKDKTSLIFAILAALLIIATRSMGTIGGTFLVLSFYSLRKTNLSVLKPRLNKAIFAILAIVIVGTVFYTKILPAIQTNYASLNEREEIWVTSLHFLKDPMTVIWGLGFGQFQNVYFTNVHEILGHNPLNYYVLQPHNIFLLFIFQYGFIGLFFLIICLVRMIRNFQLLPKELDVRTISNFIVLYFFIHGMIDTPLFKNDLLFLFILFFELGMSRIYLSPETKSIKTA